MLQPLGTSGSVGDMDNAPAQQQVNSLPGQVLSSSIGTLPESYNFAADVLEDLVDALGKEGHPLTRCQKGFFDLAIRTYRHAGVVQ